MVRNRVISIEKSFRVGSPPPAVFLLVAAKSQADYEQARGIQQFGENAECPFLFGLRNMHPDRAQQDEVESPAQGNRLRAGYKNARILQRLLD